MILKDLSRAAEAKNTLIAFRGTKIHAEQISFTPGDFNVGFRATYNVDELVYGDYPHDTISFEAYDHYGVPSFLNYETVLLYLSRDSATGKYYQEKYMFQLMLWLAGILLSSRNF